MALCMTISELTNHETFYIHRKITFLVICTNYSWGWLNHSVMPTSSAVI